MSMSYNGAFVTTILWADRGFTPDPNIYEVGNRLKEKLEELDILGAICKKLGIDTCDPSQVKYSFDETIGIQHITLGEIKDVPLNSPKIGSLTPRIYVCDDELKMKSKITVSSIIRADSDWKYSDVSKLLPQIYRKNEIICRLIHSMIPEEFNIGGINYVSHVSSIESPDNNFVDNLINSKFNKITEQLEINDKALSPLEIQTVVESYFVLMSGASFDLKNGKANLPFIIDIMKKHKVKENKIYVHQPRKDVPAKTFNFRLLENDLEDSVPHRVISNLTEVRGGQAVTRSLVLDYLSIT
jgi:hypothetical protein